MISTTTVGQYERNTQRRVIRLFTERLGYTYLGNWEDRLGNSNIEEEQLTKYLVKKGYSESIISKAIYQLKSIANQPGKSLYEVNKEFYSKLRYGIDVAPDAGENFVKVKLVNWKPTEFNDNDFTIAEEVTIQGKREKRPDIVIYVNGIALGILELKRSTVSIGDGIRQNITNQQKEFIESFFSTIQLIFAGNDTQGLVYGSIKTPEKYYLKWKEDIENNDEILLDKYLLKMCRKDRLLELIYDFTLFDGGIKKLCRPHQYFGIKEAQKFVRNKEGGIIWHTQGSGKSITMVWLAKWILENNPNARVVIITDRDDLDKQIERVFVDVGEQIKKAKSGRDLISKLIEPSPRLLCSLVHKFGKKDIEDFEEYLEELKKNPPKVKGELFVFVDECHRTQSGRFHKLMKAILNKAIFFGFTGTPLLKKDKKTSVEVFGKYVHTYKFNEAVEDEVVRDLVYEARDIDQKLSSPERVDEWFKVKTRGLNEYQQSALKQKWGTMQRVLSSKSRMGKIVDDIVMDCNTKTRLSSGFGNAMLVASSIYDACRYYELFQETELSGKVGLITSFEPHSSSIAKEDTGEETETEREYIYRVYTEELLKGYRNSTEKYEEWAKEKFIKEPSQMKLLIVVDKLLTGFDAPPCTYLYLDRKLQDHGLFQAICRVNRLDTDDKQFGYIVDYKNLFENVKGAIAVYTSELDFDNFQQEDVEVLMKDRLESAKERLDAALEEINLLCEPVPAPKGQMEFIRYFCGNPEIKEELKAREYLRTSLYKSTVALIRAYANIKADMEEAGYSAQQIEYIDERVKFYTNLREEIRNASGEILDMKTYEADMRHLIDRYIQAEDSRVISPFKNMSLLDIISKIGIEEALGTLPSNIQRNQEAVAETIENNIRQKIIKSHLIDPAYFEKMSKLLDEIIKARKNNAIRYEIYLKRIAELAEGVSGEAGGGDYPESLKTRGQRILFNNLGKDEALAKAVDEAIMKTSQAKWRGDLIKERLIKQSIFSVLKDEQEVERIFPIIKEGEDY
jgi:type I restriction enzyme, R subunit